MNCLVHLICFSSVYRVGQKNGPFLNVDNNELEMCLMCHFVAKIV